MIFSRNWNTTTVSDETSNNICSIIFMLVLLLFLYYGCSIMRDACSCLMNYAYTPKAKLTIVKYEGLTEACSICLETFALHEEIYQVKCNHCFHKECIRVWLCQNASCPLCRVVLIED